MGETWGAEWAAFPTVKVKKKTTKKHHHWSSESTEPSWTADDSCSTEREEEAGGTKRKKKRRCWHILTKCNRECHSAPHTLMCTHTHTHMHTCCTWELCLKDMAPGSELLLKATDVRNTESHIEPRTNRSHNSHAHFHTEAIAHYWIQVNKKKKPRQHLRFYKVSLRTTCRLPIFVSLGLVSTGRCL